jgi:hypothetical protein
LPRLAYLTISNAFAALRLLPVSDRDKDAEILPLRHQIMILERQLGTDRVKFAWEDRAVLAALRCHRGTVREGSCGLRRYRVPCGRAAE